MDLVFRDRFSISLILYLLIIFLYSVYVNIATLWLQLAIEHLLNITHIYTKNISHWIFIGGIIAHQVIHFLRSGSSLMKLSEPFDWKLFPHKLQVVFHYNLENLGEEAEIVDENNKCVYNENSQLLHTDHWFPTILISV